MRSFVTNMSSSCSPWFWNSEARKPPGIPRLVPSPLPRSIDDCPRAALQEGGEQGRQGENQGSGWGAAGVREKKDYQLRQLSQTFGLGILKSVFKIIEEPRELLFMWIVIS